MPNRRTRDSGHFRTNIELMIQITIVGILLAIAVPAWMKYRASRGEKCLANVAALASGPLPAGTTCPWSGKPYGAVPECPAPEGHLDGKPRLVKLPSGTWRLEQTLPEPSGEPVELSEGRVETTETPAGISLRISSRWISRIVGGALVLVLLAGAGLCIVGAVKTPDARIVLAVGAPVLLAVAGWLTAQLGSIREYRIARGTGTIVRTDRIFSWTRSTTTTDEVLGVVPVPAPSWGERKLLLLRVPGKGIEPFEGIPGKRLDVATWLNRALAR